jgi:ABC-type nickel/cobalt efflux system permease component RcnA
MRRAAFVAIVMTALAVAAPAWAHPLGNFTINQHVGLSGRGTTLAVDYVVDMAEIPTARALGGIDPFGDELTSLSASTCDAALAGLAVTAGGETLELGAIDHTVTLPPGEASLPTLRVECRFEAAFDHFGEVLEVENRNYTDRIGWKEIVVGGSIRTSEEVSRQSSSDVLSDYPDGRTLDQTSISFVVESFDEAGVGPTISTDVQTSPIPDALSRFMAGDGSAGLGVTAMLAALALGAAHAMAPGHGKTLMAAYLVGEQGAPRHAIGLGLATATSHTIGVAALGLVTLVASETFAPERVYPVLSVISGLTITGIGAVLLARALTRRRSQLSDRGDHDHDHDHHHDHGHEHGHHLGPGSHTHGGPKHTSLTWKGMAAMGLAGGLVPSASAVVLLLGAVRIGRPLIGLALVGLFGIGMSAVLVGAGMAVVSSRNIADRILSRPLTMPVWVRPVAASFVMAAGAFLTVTAVV